MVYPSPTPYMGASITDVVLLEGVAVAAPEILFGISDEDEDEVDWDTGLLVVEVELVPVLVVANDDDDAQ